MQQVVYLVVALAVAAAILSLAAAMKAVLPPPEAPLDHAQALVFIKVKPLNGSYWLGVHAPYGDVTMSQVRVGNAMYVLDAVAPVGRDVWLNASGKPITVTCNSTVELVTAKGGAARTLAFTVQCPRLEKRTDVKTMMLLDSWKEFALSAFQWISQADDSANRSVVLRPGESVFIPFNLTATLPPIFDVAPGVQIAVSPRG